MYRVPCQRVLPWTIWLFVDMIMYRRVHLTILYLNLRRHLCHIIRVIRRQDNIKDLLILLALLYQLAIDLVPQFRLHIHLRQILLIQTLLIPQQTTLIIIHLTIQCTMIKAPLNNQVIIPTLLFYTSIFFRSLVTLVTNTSILFVTALLDLLPYPYTRIVRIKRLRVVLQRILRTCTPYKVHHLLVVNVTAFHYSVYVLFQRRALVKPFVVDYTLRIATIDSKEFLLIVPYIVLVTGYKVVYFC